MQAGAALSAVGRSASRAAMLVATRLAPQPSNSPVCFTRRPGQERTGIQTARKSKRVARTRPDASSKTTRCESQREQNYGEGIA